MTPRSFSVYQAAEILGLHPRRIERLVAAGFLAAPGGRYPRVPFRSLDRYARRYGPPSALRRLHGYADRPLTVGEVADALGVQPRQVRCYIAAGKLRAYRPPGVSRNNHYLVEREHLAEFLRARGTPAALAHAMRMLRPPSARLVVATRDPLVRRATAPWEPVTVTSLFGLGWEAGRRPVWGAVIDFQLDTRDNAYDAAARLSAEAGNPALLGIAAEDAGSSPRRPPGIWDVILTRPVTADNLSTCVRELHAAAGPRP